MRPVRFVLSCCALAALSACGGAGSGPEEASATDVLAGHDLAPVALPQVASVLSAANSGAYQPTTQQDRTGTARMTGFVGLPLNDTGSSALLGSASATFDFGSGRFSGSAEGFQEWETSAQFNAQGQAIPSTITGTPGQRFDGRLALSGSILSDGALDGDLEGQLTGQIPNGAGQNVPATAEIDMRLFGAVGKDGADRMALAEATGRITVEAAGRRETGFFDDGIVFLSE